MAWTLEQQNALDVRDRNVITSAGAGAGKTATLTERITNLLSEGVDGGKCNSLDKLLVLTFTEAAALEMRERVRKKLSLNPKLKHYAEIIDTANICTFDAYSLKLVKKYGYLINVSSDITIANTTFISSKMREILDDVLDEYLKNKDERLLSIVKSEKMKSLEAFKAQLKKIYYSVILKFDTKAFLNNYIANFYNDTNIENLINRYVIVIKESLLKYENKFNSYCEVINEIKEFVAGIDTKSVLHNDEIDDFIDAYNKLILGSFSLGDIFDFVSAYPKLIPNEKTTGGKKEWFDELRELRQKASTIRTTLNKKIGDILDPFNTFKSKSDLIDNINESKSFASLVIEILLKFIDKLDEFKKENHIYEFMDIQKMAIEIVDKPIVNKELKGLYEIMIDETQDTSDIQDLFINKIANNNVFIVGDIKQSIYKFRNANPYNFKEKYDSYTPYDGKKGDNPVRIDLHFNFRSRKEVVNNINFLFSTIMTDNYGDANYIQDHQMAFGQDNYEKAQNNIDDYNMEIIRYTSPKYLDSDEVNDSKNYEIEAALIANDIKKRIARGDKKMVPNKDDKGFHMEPLEYSDFCILIDRATNFENFKKILEYNNIPLAINADLKVNEDEIVKIISSLINLLTLEIAHSYNASYYHSLASVYRSYLYEMDDEALFELIMSSKKLDKSGRYYEFIAPATNSVSTKIKNIAEHIGEYSNSDIYRIILEEFNVVERLPLVGDVKAKMVILETIQGFIDNVSALGVDFTEINKYMADILANDDYKYSIDTKNNPGVKLMTIHKSKGLEFPVCYYSLLGAKFNKSDLTGNYGYFQESGFYGPSDFNIIKKIGASEYLRKDISEKIRLFYVALTRAKEKIIIISPDMKEDNIPSTPALFESFNDMIHYASTKINLNSYIKRVETPVADRGYLKNETKEYDYNPKCQYNPTKHLGNKIELSRISKEVIEVLSDSEQRNIDLGLELHAIMEAIDFTNIDLSFIENNYHKSLIENIINKNPLFKNIKFATTYHEHEFYFTGKKEDGTPCDYHGIIDMLAVYPDHIDIIDYKLSNIEHKEYDRQLSIYKQYVKTLFDKEINCYLLALMDGNYREVK